MLENEIKEIEDQRLPAKNLKQALLALGYAILANVAFFLVFDSLRPSSGRTLHYAMITVYYLLTVISGVYAFLACRNSLKSLQTNKNPRNYIALVIGGLLLLGIAKQVLNHF